MKKRLFFNTLLVLALLPFTSQAQFDEDQLGAWYMYFYNTTFNDGPWGIQGDAQYRNWDMGGDLEQLLLRSGLTFVPGKSKVKLTLGYANITTGAFGSENSTTGESRIYQEVLFPFKASNRFLFNNRLRFEQRFVEDQNFRTRVRYNLFLNIPLNKPEWTDKTIYLALYNEIFLNGEKEIGDGRSVDTFDRNRLYGAIGYVIRKGLMVQLGVMRQTTSNWSKNQLQLSLHHTI